MQTSFEALRLMHEAQKRYEFERNCGNLEWMQREAERQARDELEKQGLYEVAKLVGLPKSVTPADIEHLQRVVADRQNAMGLIVPVTVVIVFLTICFIVANVLVFVTTHV